MVLTGVLSVAYYATVVVSVAYVGTLVVHQTEHSLEVSSSMSQAFRKFLSISLVLCVLAIGGLAQAQSAEHAGHHAQHQAATHGTLLCSWMCAAGTVLDSDVVLIQVERSPIEIIPLAQSPDPSIQLCQAVPSRAPPALFL